MTEAAPPLTTLLSWAWIAFAKEADNAVEATNPPGARARFQISLAMWANALRLISEDGATLDDVRTGAHAGANIAGLERWGWITVGPVTSGPRDGYGTSRGLRGDIVLRATRAGATARELWPRVIAEVEQRWEDRFGVDVVDALRRGLQSLGRDMPWAPPEVGPADGFRSRVIPGDGGDAHDFRLVVLLGRALTELTLTHERGAAVSLPLAANVLRVIGAQTVRVCDLPSRSGVSKEAATMAVSFLERRGLAKVDAARTIALRTAGLVALDDYAARAAHISNDGLRSSITAIVAKGDAFARGLVPTEGSWRLRAPYVAQTKRLANDPIAALPRHPMVLHRGGRPDGS